MRRSTRLLAMLFAGCTAAYYDPYYYTYPYYYTDMYGYEDYYYYTGVYGYYPVYRDAATIAQDAAVNAPSFFSPAGCATATTSGTTATVTLNNCRAPYGLAGVSGSYSLTFTELSPTSGTIALTSQAITDTHGRAITLSSTATYNVDGSVVNLAIKSSSTFQAADVNATVVRRANESTLVITQGSRCLTHNGRESITLNDQTWTVDTTDYTRCLGQCPTGTFTFTPPDGNTVTIEYDGSNVSRISRADGASRSTVVACGEVDQ